MFSNIRSTSLLGDRTNSRREEEQQSPASSQKSETDVTEKDCANDDDEDMEMDDIDEPRNNHRELPVVDYDESDYEDPQYRADQNNLPVAEELWRFTQCGYPCPTVTYIKSQIQSRACRLTTM